MADKYTEVILYLTRPNQFDEVIEKKWGRIKELRASLAGISINYSDMPKAPSGCQSQMEEALVRIVDLEKEVKVLEKAKENITEKIINSISQYLDVDEMGVVFDLYLLGYEWSVSVRRAGMSVRQFRNVRDSALEKLLQNIRTIKEEGHG